MADGGGSGETKQGGGNQAEAERGDFSKKRRGRAANGAEGLKDEAQGLAEEDKAADASDDGE